MSQRSRDERPRVVDTLLIETTWRCNAACAYCYNHYVPERTGQPPRAEPSTRTSRKIVETAIRGSGARQVAFTGGESTLRDDIFDLIATARMNGATVSLLTNGSLIDDAFVRDLVRVGCGLVQLTFCGVEAAVHDALCGAGSFDRTMRALESLRRNRLPLGLTFVATRRNLEHAARFPAFVRAAGVDQFLLNRFNPGGRGALGSGDVPDLLPGLLELREMLARVDDAAAAARVRPFAAVPIMPCLASAASTPHITFASGCAAGTRRAYFTVDPWGNVRFCNHTPTVLGNVLEAPFSSFVESPKLAEFRDAKPPFCVRCPGWDVCRGGCRAAAEQLHGRWDSEDPLLAACLARGEIRVPGETPF
jgi:radical SAM protein with 4Fe4S-binding SPASM domain